MNASRRYGVISSGLPYGSAQRVPFSIVESFIEALAMKVKAKPLTKWNE